MKKLMIGLAAVGLCGAVFADITSANVVGYQNIKRPAAYQNSCGGSLFMNIGKSQYTLADIKINVEKASNDRGNYIVFMASGATMKVDKDRAYWWDTSVNKWRIRNGATKSKDGTEEHPENVIINPGEGFLCNFAQDTTTISYSGEVLQGLEKKFVITRPEGKQNFVSCNVAGREISLNDIKITVEKASNDRGNYIVFMASGATMKVDKDRAYWWDTSVNKWRIRNGATKSKDGTEEHPENVKIAAGEGFLCNFAQDSTTLTLPTAL